MIPSFFSGLRARLLALVSLAVLPALAILFHSGATEAERIEQAVQEEAAQLSAFAVIAQRNLLEGTRQWLDALARSAEVRSADPLVCDPFLAFCLSASPTYLNIGLIELDGRVSCSALPRTEPVNKGDRDFFRKAVEERVFTVGGFAIGELSKKGVVHYAVPVLDEHGEAERVLYASQGLEWLNQNLSTLPLPPGGALVVFDRRGIVLARNPDPTPWVGTAHPDTPLVRAVLEQGSGAAEVAGLDGVTRLYVFEAFPARAAPDLHVAVGIPKDLVAAPARLSWSRRLGWLCLVALLALGVAWFAGTRLIVEPVHALTRTARQMEAGDLGVRSGVRTASGELGELARAFDRMAEAVARRTRERDEAERSANASRRVLQAILDNTTAHVFAKDREGRFLFVNRRFEQQSGIAASRLLGRTAQECFSQPEARSFADHDRAVLAQGRSLTFLDRVTLPDGLHTLSTELFPLPDHDGATGGVCGIATDITELVRAEEERARSASVLQAVVDHVPAAIYVKGLDGRFTFVNHHLAALVQRTPDEMLGKTDHDFFPREMADEYRANDCDVLERGQPLSREERAPHRDGPHTYVSVKLPLRDASGGTFALCGISTDITERVRAGEERERLLAREQEARTEIERARAEQAAILERITDAFVALDADWRYTYVNEKAAAIFGRRRAELVGKHIWSEFPEGVGQPFHRAYEQAIAQQTPVQLEEYYPPWDRWYENRVYPGPDGLSIFFQDVTERRRLQESLRESEQRLRKIVETEPECVKTVARDGALVEMNAAGLAMIEAPSLEAVRGKSIHALVEARHRASFRDLTEAVFRGESGRLEFEITGLRGTRRWLESHAVPLRDARGEVAFLLAVTRDVTQRRRAEEEIRQLNADLERKVLERTAALHEANQELEAFAYTVSHDLRAPLRAIQGFAEVFLSDYADRLEPQGLDYARRLSGAAQRMDRLIQDLLAYSRISRGELRLQPVDLAGAVGEAVGELRASTELLAGCLTIDVPSCVVLSNRSVLVQVLANLLGNAVKFVAPGTPPRVHVRAEERAGCIRLWVADEGIGIAAEHQRRIFQVFERLHAAQTYPGTGIGLAIVKRGVERMGGRVGVESAPGLGSRFWVELQAVVGRMEGQLA